MCKFGKTLLINCEFITRDRRGERSIEELQLARPQKKLVCT